MDTDCWAQFTFRQSIAMDRDGKQWKKWRDIL